MVPLFLYLHSRISRHPSQGPDSTERIHLPDDIAVVQSGNTLPTPKKARV